MNKPIIKRLTELEKEFFRDVWADITYNDGRKGWLKIIDVLNFYTNGKKAPKITDVSFIGDVSRQGILPDLVKYFIETNR
jgi:hypothetical protein